MTCPFILLYLTHRQKETGQTGEQIGIPGGHERSFGESKTDLLLRIQTARSAGHLVIHCAAVEGFSGKSGSKVRKKRGMDGFLSRSILPDSQASEIAGRRAELRRSKEAL